MTWVIILSYISYTLSLLKGVTQCATSVEGQRVCSEPHNNKEVTEVTVFMGKWKSSNICYEAKSPYTLAQEDCVFVAIFLFVEILFSIILQIDWPTCALPLWWLLTNTSPHGCSDLNIYRTLIRDTGNGKQLPYIHFLARHTGANTWVDGVKINLVQMKRKWLMTEEYL